MAWKVIGCMPGRDKANGMPAIYGPLPVKVWVKRAGEKRPRIKRAVNALAGKSSGLEDIKEYNARRAVEYARWLAARDGVALPDGGAAPRFEPVRVPGRKSPELRVSAVVFYHPLPAQTYRPKPRGYQPQSELAKVAPVTIQIPNWDWIPRDPVETIDPEPAQEPVDSMFDFRETLRRDGMFVPVMGAGFQMMA